MARKFTIWDVHRGDKLVRLEISDADNLDEYDSTHSSYRPPIASFSISQKYDFEHQQALAIKLRDYLNLRQSAMNQAVDDNALLQKLML